MALTIEVTKGSVTETMPKLWNITLNMICLEGQIEVLNQDFTVRYRTGDDAEVKVKGMLEEMQAAIDRYILEDAIFDHVKLATAVTYLQTNLDGGE